MKSVKTKASEVTPTLGLMRCFVSEVVHGKSKPVRRDQEGYGSLPGAAGRIAD